MDHPPGTTLLMTVGLHPWTNAAVASTAIGVMPWGAQYCGPVPFHFT